MSVSIYPAVFGHHAASFIHDCGKRLNVPQITINTAIVLMHRFYMFHSFAKYDKFEIATASLFVAGKAEESKRSIAAILAIKHELLKKPPVEPKSDDHKRKSDELIDHELVLLQTFGFDVRVVQPMRYVNRAAICLRISFELAQMIEFLVWVGKQKICS